MIPYEETLEEIMEKASIERKELEDKIKKKHTELSGLVSMQGAAHLVARDLGINILVKKRELKIKDLKDGMKNVDVKARISLISDPIEFERKDGSKGKVSNLFITDGTGDIRIPIWDKQVDQLKEHLNQGDVVEIKNGMVRVNNIGSLELRVSAFSRIEKLKDDGSIPEEAPVKTLPTEKIEIKNVKEGFYSIRGNIVQLFKINFTYMMCPECRMKVENNKCSEHGKVKPEVNMIVSGILDDGTGNLRAVFFRDQAQKISGLEPKTLAKLDQDEGYKMLKDAILGKEVVISGRVQKNKMFENLEMVVNNVQETNPIEEGKKIINEIKSLG